MSDGPMPVHGVWFGIMVVLHFGSRSIFARKRTLSLTPWVFRSDRVSHPAWMLSIVVHAVVVTVLARQLEVATCPRVPDSMLPVAWLGQSAMPPVTVEPSLVPPTVTDERPDVVEMTPMPEVPVPELPLAKHEPTEAISSDMVLADSVAPVPTADYGSAIGESSTASNYWMLVRSRFSSSLKWPSHAHGSITVTVHIVGGSDGLRFSIPPEVPSPYANALERAARRVRRTVEPPPPDAGTALVTILFDEP